LSEIVYVLLERNHKNERIYHTNGCALDPETAKKIRDDRKPEHEDSCSMCGKFCAVHSMNKALSGEYIDIL